MPEEKQPFPTPVSQREQPSHGTPSFPVEIFELSIPESTIPWHWHEDWEYVLCTRNRVKCSTAQGEIVLEPGYGAFLGPRVIHEITAEDGTCGIRSLVFHPHFLGNEGSLIWQKYVAPVQECGAIKLCPDIPWQWDCMHFFCVAWHAMDQRGPGYEIETRQALENAVYRLSLQAELRESSLSEKVRRNTQRLEQMLQFIRRNYGEELTVSQIADSAAISESECLRCFRSCLHTSPSRYSQRAGPAPLFRPAEGKGLRPRPLPPKQPTAATRSGPCCKTPIPRWSGGSIFSAVHPGRVSPPRFCSPGAAVYCGPPRTGTPPPGRRTSPRPRSLARPKRGYHPIGKIRLALC